MKKNLTEIVFILDRSGSMSGLEQDTIGGFNSMLRKQKSESGEAYVSTVLFDSQMSLIHDRLPIAKVPELTENEYYVRGCTALLDAVGSSIHHIANIHKYLPEEVRPEKTVFIITTDGMENSSRKYSYEKLRSMVEHEKEKHGWEFIFLGANIDAAAEAARIGIDDDMSVNYHADEKGTRLAYKAMSDAVSSVRSCAGICPPTGWRGDLDNDYNSRKNNR